MTGGVERDAQRRIIEEPPHYCEGRKFEQLEVALDWGLSLCLGQVLKYVSRAGRKGEAVEDLRKAKFYLEREIKRLEEDNVTRT